MCDLPENLQVIKREPLSPTTSEDISPHNIKAKLNLHVKRRLQDYGHGTEDSDLPHVSNTQQQGVALITENNSKSSKDTQQKEVRQKRPYHKKTDKTKSTATGTQQNTEGASLTPQRKNKTKFKTVVTTGNPDTLTPNSQDDMSHAAASNAGGISAGDDDDAGHDNELKQNREKEKCPDVLGMVLSMKKRALMQDPEVQQFLSEVMKVIKS